MLGHSFKKSSYEQKIEHALTKTTDKTARSNIYLVHESETPVLVASNYSRILLLMRVVYLLLKALYDRL